MKMTTLYTTINLQKTVSNEGWLSNSTVQFLEYRKVLIWDEIVAFAEYADTEYAVN